MFNAIFNTISNWAEALINLVITILNTIIKWIDDIINWFRNKIAGIRTRIAYVMTMIELRTKLDSVNMGDLLDGPNVNVVHIEGLYGEDTKFEEGVVQIIHDNETNNIIDMRLIGGNGIDNNLKNAMKGANIIKLT